MASRMVSITSSRMTGRGPGRMASPSASSNASMSGASRVRAGPGSAARSLRATVSSADARLRRFRWRSSFAVASRSTMSSAARAPGTTAPLSGCASAAAARCRSAAPSADRPASRRREAAAPCVARRRTASRCRRGSGPSGIPAWRRRVEEYVRRVRGAWQLRRVLPRPVCTKGDVATLIAGDNGLTFAVTQNRQRSCVGWPQRVGCVRI